MFTTYFILKTLSQLILFSFLRQEYHDKTCIRFRPRTSEQAYIHIMKEIMSIPVCRICEKNSDVAALFLAFLRRRLSSNMKAYLFDDRT
jgi:hypothetical protein